jgi:PTH1 family peptidyl-tRNA hydrolase
MAEDKNKYLIVGLGNPGSRYRNTRHNFGFMVLDKLAEDLNAPFRRIQHKAMISKAHRGDKLIILAKPRTYMNNSGQSVSSLTRFYKVPLQNILICFDDADLDFDTIRLRSEGGSSGQKGMASIINSLGSQQIPRMRLGLGRPSGKMDTANFVLLPFSNQEEEILPFILDRAASAVLTFIDEGITTAMNKFNTKGS